MDNYLMKKTPEEKFYIFAAEFKNPIHTILGYASLMKMNIEQNKIDPEDLLKKLEKIIDTANKMNELRDELLKS